MTIADFYFQYYSTLYYGTEMYGSWYTTIQSLGVVCSQVLIKTHIFPHTVIMLKVIFRNKFPTYTRTRVLKYFNKA